LLGSVVLWCMAGSSFAMVYFGYQTAQATGSTAPWLWALGMLVPCVSVIVLLVLSSQATQLCRESGIPVGFLGPKIGPRV